MRWMVVPALLACATTMSSVAGADDETDAKALVERWVIDQNTASFADYETLYAKRFFGIRRSGEREVDLDRAGWMKDRKRMFNPKRPAKVEVGDLRVTIVPSGIELTFTQKFSQGTFSDEGHKQMLLRRDEGQLRIADERMQSSHLEHEKAPKPLPWTSALGIVNSEGIVLPYAVEKSWVAPGKPRQRVDKNGRQVTRWKLHPDRLPAAARALVGRPVEIFTSNGKTCETRIKSLALVAVVSFDPQMGGSGDADSDINVFDTEARLMAEVEGACDKGFVARELGVQPPPVFATELKDPALKKAALAAARALPLYRAMTASRASKHDWVWETQWRDMRATVTGVPERWISVSLYGEGGCDSDALQLWALFSVTDSPTGPKLTLLNDPGKEAVTPTLLLDVDGDGAPEILYDLGSLNELGYDFDGGVVRRKAGRLGDVEKVRNRYLGCPC